MGELGRHINLKKAQAARKEQRLKWRQILSLLYDHYRVSETDGAIHDFQDLLNAEMKGGDLRAFFQRMETNGRRNVAGSRSIHFGDALSHPGPEAGLREHLSYFERLPVGLPEKNCQFLLALARRYLEAKRRRKARDDMSNEELGPCPRQMGHDESQG